jgi:hypothetical protein
MSKELQSTAESNAEGPRESSETQGENPGRVDFFDVAEDAELIVKFVGEIRTANNKYKSRYMRAEIQDLSPNAQIRNVQVKNLNLKRTVLRKEVISRILRTASSPTVCYLRSRGSDHTGRLRKVLQIRGSSIIRSATKRIVKRRANVLIGKSIYFHFFI